MLQTNIGVFFLNSMSLLRTDLTVLENCVIFESSVKTSLPLLSFAIAVLAVETKVFISENNLGSSTEGSARLNMKPRG